MLDGNNRSHTVTHISSSEICIFFLQNSKLAGILIHHRCKNGLKTGDVCTALCIVNIVTEAKYIFMEFICILESSFHRNAFALTLEINHIMQYFCLFVQITDKSDNSFFLMINDMFRLLAAQILINDRQLRIQICGLMQTAFYLILFESCFFKNLRIRKEINLCSGLFCLSDHRKQTIHQRLHCHAALIAVMVNRAVPANLYIQIGGQCVYYRRTHAVQTTTCLVYRIIKFSSRMQCRKNKSCRRNSFFMHSNRNTSSIILNGTGAIRFQCHPDLTAGSCQMLVHRIIYDFIDQVVQTLAGYTSDVHTRTLTHRFQTFQYGNTPRVICYFICHFFTLSTL